MTRLSKTTPTTTPKPTSPKQWAALGALLLPVLLVSVDNTVLGFAVPALSSDLRPTADQLLWIVDSYSLVLAGLLVTMGSLGDRIGRRRLLLLGATGFGAASLLAAFAPTAEVLIAARVLLGVAGATLMPSTLSLIRNVFTDRRARTTAIAAWTATFAAGAAIGPLLGGFLLEHFRWGSVFLINLPVMALLLVVGPLLVPESRDSAPGRFDLPGAALSLGAMTALVLGVKSIGGPVLVPLGALAAAALLGWLFVRRQRRTEAPLLDLRLFADRGFSASVVSNLLVVFVMVGGLFFLTQHLQLVLGMSPLLAGLALLPGVLLTMAGSALAVPLLRRVRLADLLGCSLVCTAVGCLLLVGLRPEGGPWLLVAAFMVIGLGAGVTETATNDRIVSTVPPNRAGAASAISETAYELGAALGVAVLGTVLTTAYRAGLPEEVLPVAGETLGGALATAAELPGDGGAALRETAVAAFTSGVHLTSLIGVAFLAIAAAQAWWALRHER
ncbi:MFS transporter [Saccharopolyspora sp. CA-218241]|uniref:MFS transporter n=1 Tax=Saccharopolyspora sp. CA-218241 TaxID=3240027 RepID=UPI003D994EB9